MKVAPDKIEWHLYPEEDIPGPGDYFITITDWSGYNPEVEEIYCAPGDTEFYSCGSEIYETVTAWARYPEPYKGDGSSEDSLWTPCSRRLPEDGAKCLVTCDLGYRRVATMGIFVAEDKIFDTAFHSKVDMIAWMYYPEPPKGSYYE